MRTLEEHLAQYGIRRFDSEGYWDWAARKMGTKAAAKVEKMRSALGIMDDARMRKLADFVAAPNIAGPFHSRYADALRVTTEALNQRVINARRILELGCGIGCTATWLAYSDPRREVVGVDYSRASIASAIRYAAKMEITNVLFREGDVTRDLGTDQYDAVIDLDCLKNVWDAGEPKLRSALAEIDRVLAPGGSLVCAIRLGRVAEAQAFQDVCNTSGFSIHAFEFAITSDLGGVEAVPIVTLDRSDTDVAQDLHSLYDGVRERLRAAM